MANTCEECGKHPAKTRTPHAMCTECAILFWKACLAYNRMLVERRELETV